MAAPASSDASRSVTAETLSTDSGLGLSFAALQLGPRQELCSMILLNLLCVACKLLPLSQGCRRNDEVLGGMFSGKASRPMQYVAAP